MFSVDEIRFNAGYFATLGIRKARKCLDGIPELLGSTEWADEDGLAIAAAIAERDQEEEQVAMAAMVSTQVRCLEKMQRMAATRIQCALRKWVCKIHYDAVRIRTLMAVVKIQSVWRGRSYRKSFAGVLNHSQIEGGLIQWRWKRRVCATMIQNAWRKRKTKKEAKRTFVAAFKIQAAWRKRMLRASVLSTGIEPPVSVYLDEHGVMRW